MKETEKQISTTKRKLDDTHSLSNQREKAKQEKERIFGRVQFTSTEVMDTEEMEPSDNEDESDEDDNDSPSKPGDMLGSIDLPSAESQDENEPGSSRLKKN